VRSDNNLAIVLWVLAAVVLASILLYLLLAPWLFAGR
jgi:hypothetical protein